MTDGTTVRWRHDDGIVILTFDAPGSSVNTMDDAYIRSMAAVLDRLEDERDEIAGVVLTSAKASFFTGGDLGEILALGPGDAARFAASTKTVKDQLRRLETLGLPVVAALGGAALGEGLEIALAAHRRIMVDAPGAAVGFPEVSLGLLPGAGGIVRTVRMLGIERALTDVLLSNRRFGPREALDLGLVDEVVADAASLVPAARAWITVNPDATQPWDRPGYRIPGGAGNSLALTPLLTAIPAMLRARTRGVPLPAPRAMAAAAVEGAEVDVDTAMLIETRYVVSLATGQTAKNLISGFFDLRAVADRASRPTGVAPYQARMLAVIGAGTMGAGIALAAANAGIEVVLKDVDAAAAARGKAHAARLLERAVQRGSAAASDTGAVLARIVPTADPRALRGADAVIEAVFEFAELKQQVLREAERVVPRDALVGSTTSSLPITELAGAVTRPESVVGFHFFSPVDRTRLVEIVVGERTSEASVSRAVDLARQLGKTPIVVRDGRGFFTTRVVGTAIVQALAAVGEGVPAAAVEQAAVQAGYPVGFLQLLDELTLTVALRDADAPAAAVLDRMIDEFGRTGRAGGAGFYDYAADGTRMRLWPGLRDAFAHRPALPDPLTGSPVPFADLKERFLFAEALESVRCLDDGVLRSVLDGNVGSILGIGYPAWTGGVFRYIDTYPGGMLAFVARARELAERYGRRFDPPPSLTRRAASGERYSSSKSK
jgi:3-hydroxyacyl-CoA dehydrogenase/enoyl-CoA hydratase/3-hydroxybutyryl-CoA epimerase